jgi:hypothetical protein
VQSEWTLNLLLLLVSRSGRLNLLFFWRSLFGQAFQCLSGQASLPFQVSGDDQLLLRMPSEPSLAPFQELSPQRGLCLFSRLTQMWDSLSQARAKPNVSTRLG